MEYILINPTVLRDLVDREIAALDRLVDHALAGYPKKELPQRVSTEVLREVAAV